MSNFPNEVIIERATALQGQVIRSLGTYSSMSAFKTEDESVNVGEFVAYKTTARNTIVGQAGFSTTANIIGVAVLDDFIASTDIPITNYPKDTTVTVMTRGVIAVTAPADCKPGQYVGVDSTTKKMVFVDKETDLTTGQIQTKFTVERGCKANDIAFIIA